MDIKALPDYQFQNISVNVNRRELRVDHTLKPLQPKVFDLLLYLIARRDRVVGKQELQDALWPDVVVTESSLARCVAKCRQALADDGVRQNLIKTVHGRGYRFVGTIERQAVPVATTAPQPTPAASPLPSLVVLPLVNISGNRDDDIFADGLTEDIIVDLSRNGWLYVIGRNTAFSYKGQAVQSSVVAEELGVRYVVAGSVRKIQNRLRVSVELVDARHGTQEWAERYDRDITDLFAVQDEICLGIVGALGSELRRAEAKRARSADPNSLDAWGWLHRGMAVSWASFNEHSNQLAEQHYRKALGLAPNDARAHAFLANNLAMRAMNGWVENPRSLRESAREHGQKAWHLAPDDPIVLGQMGHMHSCLLEPDVAIRLFERSIQMDPNGIFSLAMRAMALTALGRPEEAIEAVKDALKRSPRDLSVSWYLTMLCWAYLQLNDFDSAIESAQQGITFYNGWHASWMSLGLAFGCKGQWEQGRTAVRRARDITPRLTCEGYSAYFRYMSKDAGQARHRAEILAKLWD